jgi:hypothetical protein
MNLSVCIGSGYLYVFTKNKNLSMYIYRLSRIHNTSPVSAYFGLYKREHECLEYIYMYRKNRNDIL